MSDNIKVAVKVRPLIKREKDNKINHQWSIKDNQISLVESHNDSSFVFDHIFGEETKNEQVFQTLAKPIVDASINGFNGTIFAYGQTSSGKTHTMLGNEFDPGIMVLSIREIFCKISRCSDREFLVRVSYIEIYNEKIYDLLETKNRELKIFESVRGDPQIDCAEIIAKCEDDVMEQLHCGNNARHIAETQMNERSSRSHTIFRVIVESREYGVDDSPVQVSNLNLVDLAGSERASQTGTAGSRLVEGGHINKSLLSLSRVIQKLSESEELPHGHINYRDSKLTRILQASLGGNTLTAIICTITPAAIDESYYTLSFAMRAKSIKNRPKVNEVLTDTAMISRLEKQILNLQKQLVEERKRVNCIEADKIQRRITETSNLILHCPMSEEKALEAKSRRRTWCPSSNSLGIKGSTTSLPLSLSPMPQSQNVFSKIPNFILTRDKLADYKIDDEEFRPAGEISFMNSSRLFMGSGEDISPFNLLKQRTSDLVKSSMKPEGLLTPTSLKLKIKCKQSEQELAELKSFTNIEKDLNVEHNVDEALRFELEAMTKENQRLHNEHLQLLDKLKWSGAGDGIDAEIQTSDANLAPEVNQKLIEIESKLQKTEEKCRNLELELETHKTLQTKLSEVEKKCKNYEIETKNAQASAKSFKMDFDKAIKAKEFAESVKTSIEYEFEVYKKNSKSKEEDLVQNLEEARKNSNHQEWKLKLVTLETTITQLEAQNNKLQTERDELSKHLLQSNESFKTALTLQEAQNNQISEMELKCTTQLEAIVSLQEQLKAETTQHQEDKLRDATIIQELQQNVEKVADECKSFENKLKEKETCCKNLSEKLQHRKNFATDLQTNIMANMESVREMEKKFMKKDEHVEHLLNLNKQLEASMTEKHLLIEELGEKVQEYQKKLEEIGEKKLDASEITTSVEDFHLLQKKNQELEEQLLSLKCELNAQVVEFSSYKSSNEKAVEELQRLNAQKDAEEEKPANDESASLKLVDLQKTINELTKNLADVESEKEEIQKEFDQCSEQVIQQIDEIEELRKNLEDLKATSAGPAVNLKSDESYDINALLELQTKYYSVEHNVKELTVKLAASSQENDELYQKIAELSETVKTKTEDVRRLESDYEQLVMQKMDVNDSLTVDKTKTEEESVEKSNLIEEVDFVQKCQDLQNRLKERDDMISALTAETNQHKAQQMKLSALNAELTAKLTRTEGARADLEEILETNSSNLKAVEDEFNCVKTELMETIKRMEDEKSGLEARLNDTVETNCMEIETLNLKETIETLESEKLEFDRKMSENSSAMKQLEDDLSSSFKKINNLEQEIAKVNKENAETSEKLKKSENEIISIQIELKECNELKEELRQKLSEAMKNVEILKDEIETSRKQIQLLEKDIENYNENLPDVDELIESSKRFEQQVAELTEQKNSQEEQVLELIKEKETLEDLSQKSNEKIKEQSAKMQEIMSENQLLTDQIKIISENVSEKELNDFTLQSELNVKNNEITTLNCRIQELEMNRQSLADSLDSLKITSQDFETLKAAHNELELQLQTARDEQTITSKMNEIHQANLKKFQDIIESLEKERNDLKQKLQSAIESAEEDSTTAESLKSKLTLLQENNTKMEEEVQQLTFKCTKFETQIDAICTENAESIRTKEQMQQNREDEHLKIVTQLKEQHEALTVELRNSSQTLKILENDCGKLKRDVEKAETDYVELQQKSSKDLQSMASENAVLQQKIAENEENRIKFENKCLEMEYTVQQITLERNSLKQKTAELERLRLQLAESTKTQDFQKVQMKNLLEKNVQIETQMQETVFRANTLKAECEGYKITVETLMKNINELNELVKKNESFAEKYAQLETELCELRRNYHSEQSFIEKEAKIRELKSQLRDADELRHKNTKLTLECDELRHSVQSKRRSRRQSTHDEKRSSLWPTNDVGTMTCPSDHICNCDELNRKLMEANKDLKIKVCQLDTLQMMVKNNPPTSDIEQLKTVLKDQEMEKQTLRTEMKRLRESLQVAKQRKCDACEDLKRKRFTNQDSQTFASSSPTATTNTSAVVLQVENDKLKADLQNRQSKYSDLKKMYTYLKTTAGRDEGSGISEKYKVLQRKYEEVVSKLQMKSKQDSPTAEGTDMSHKDLKRACAVQMQKIIKLETQLEQAKQQQNLPKETSPNEHLLEQKQDLERQLQEMQCNHFIQSQRVAELQANSKKYEATSVAEIGRLKKLCAQQDERIRELSASLVGKVDADVCNEKLEKLTLKYKDVRKLCLVRREHITELQKQLQQQIVDDTSSQELDTASMLKKISLLEVQKNEQGVIIDFLQKENVELKSMAKFTNTSTQCPGFSSPPPEVDNDGQQTDESPQSKVQQKYMSLKKLYVARCDEIRQLENKLKEFLNHQEKENKSYNNN